MSSIGTCTRRSFRRSQSIKGSGRLILGGRLAVAQEASEISDLIPKWEGR
jgi:hypothetical protein